MERAKLTRNVKEADMRAMVVGYYLQRIRKLPFRVVLKKALVKFIAFALHKLEGFKAKLSPAHISDEQLLKSLNGFENFQEALDHIRRERPKFFIEPSMKGELISLIQSELPQLKDQIVAEADKICFHIFDLLGSGDVNLDQFIKNHGGKENCGHLPWHFDFKSGYQWNPKKYYKDIEIPYGKADIKVPWELSRFYHAITLGQAYWLTEDEKYAREFIKQVDDWIDNDPPKFGVNWRCTMDVAIRVCNWIWGFYFFKDSDSFDDKFFIKFLKSFYQHGKHIMNNLENQGVTNNHYLADLVSLIYLGIIFPEFNEAKQWRNFGIQELIKEMEKQVYEDGMDYEGSTCYHRLTLELFFFATLLCDINGIQLPEEFLKKLQKMFDFVLYVLKPNGKIPQIGDNDNGRLHILGIREVLDLTYLLTFSTIYLDDPKYKIKEFGFATETLWIFGPESYDRWKEMQERSFEEIESKAFPIGGIYVMRKKKDYIVISCGPNGRNGKDGHSHNDKLSFELCVDGKDIIVDPGTYVYTSNPKLRNKFRSTSYHNTAIVDDKEQNEFIKGNIFKMGNNTKTKCLKWETGKNDCL